MSNLMSDLYRSARKSFIGPMTEQTRELMESVKKVPMNQLAESMAVTFVDKAVYELAFEATSIMGLVAFEQVLKTVLSTIDAEDRTDFLTLMLSAIYYKIAMGDSKARLSDFHPSFINEEQDS